MIQENNLKGDATEEDIMKAIAKEYLGLENPTDEAIREALADLEPPKTKAYYKRQAMEKTLATKQVRACILRSRRPSSPPVAHPPSPSHLPPISHHLPLCMQVRKVHPGDELEEVAVVSADKEQAGMKSRTGGVVSVEVLMTPERLPNDSRMTPSRMTPE